jgi:hypothetical protein
VWRSVGLVAVIAACGRVGFDDSVSTDASARDAAADVGGPAIPTLISSGTGGGSDTSSSMSVTVTGLTAAPGHLLVVAVLSYTGADAVSAVLDDANDTYVSVNARAASDDGASEIWYAASSIGAVTNVKVMFDGITGGAVWFAEFAGVAPKSPLDGEGEATSDVQPTIRGPTVETSEANDLVVSVIEISSGDVVAVDAPYVNLPAISGDDASYGVAPSPGTNGVTWTADGTGETVATTAAFTAATP